MAATKRGKNVRIPHEALAIMERLKEKLTRVTHIGGHAVPPAVKVGDGAVILWSLAMCDFIMNPKFSVVDTEDFAEQFMEKVDAVLADSENCTKDEMLARIRMAVAASSAVGGYNADDTLRAASPGGETPS